MARVDTLPHFLTDVADAIREKKGTEETIQASDFDTEIENLPTGVDLSEYFEQEFDDVGNYEWVNKNYLKKAPEITIPNEKTILSSFCSRYNLAVLPKIICGSNVTKMDNMFSSCTNVVEIDLSGLNTSNVTDMSSMFGACSSLTNLNFSNFNTAKVNTMKGMFGNCSNLTSLDLSSFNTSSVTNMQEMFSGCKKLMYLDIRNFTFDTVMTNIKMFGGSSSNYVPANCEIIVKSQTEKDWVLNVRSDLTNVKTVAEYEAEQNI